MQNEPLLSIGLLCYNQEDYILDALKGVAMQEVNFEYELVIGDDCSTDRTLQLIEEYLPVSGIRNYRILPRPENLGMQLNWKDIILQSRGKYIAPLEGDDFWTDRHKLQTQMDVIARHPGCAGSFHNTEERYNDENRPSFLYIRNDLPTEIRAAHFLKINLMPTCSIIYRSELLKNAPEWLFSMEMVDWPMNMYCCLDAPFIYVPKVMGVHRLHDKSIWSFKSSLVIRNYIIRAYDNMIDGFAGMNKELVQQLIQVRTEFVANKQPGLVKRILGKSKRVYQRLFKKSCCRD